MKASEELKEILELADKIDHFWYYDYVDNEFGVIKRKLGALQARLEAEEGDKKE